MDSETYVPTSVVNWGDKLRNDVIRTELYNTSVAWAYAQKRFKQKPLAVVKSKSVKLENKVMLRLTEDGRASIERGGKGVFLSSESSEYSLVAQTDREMEEIIEEIVYSGARGFINTAHTIAGTHDWCRRMLLSRVDRHIENMRNGKAADEMNAMLMMRSEYLDENSANQKEGAEDVIQHARGREPALWSVYRDWPTVHKLIVAGCVFNFHAALDHERSYRMAEVSKQLQYAGQITGISQGAMGSYPHAAQQWSQMAAQPQAANQNFTNITASMTSPFAGIFGSRKAKPTP
jgi:hypothetical protein